MFTSPDSFMHVYIVWVPPLQVSGFPPAISGIAKLVNRVYIFIYIFTISVQFCYELYTFSTWCCMCHCWYIKQYEILKPLAKAREINALFLFRFIQCMFLIEGKNATHFINQIILCILSFSGERHVFQLQGVEFFKLVCNITSFLPHLMCVSSNWLSLF